MPDEHSDYNVQRELGGLEQHLIAIDERLDRLNTYLLRLGERLDLMASFDVRLRQLEAEIKDLRIWAGSFWQRTLLAAAAVSTLVVAGWNLFLRR